jgi:hypothetical protein
MINLLGVGLGIVPLMKKDSAHLGQRQTTRKYLGSMAPEFRRKV